MRILLLQDNSCLNATIANHFRAKGYRIDSFSDGKEAYRAIDNGYACFILEINTPNLGGIQILKKIRDYYPEVPVVIMSINSDAKLQIVKEAYNYGCSDFIKKPFLIDELEIKIEKLCNVRRDVIKLGHNCQFDFKMGLLKIENLEKRFSRKESLLLSIFISEKNKIVSFEKIKAIVWEGNHASLESIRSLIRRLRQKLPSKCIETIMDTGYILKDNSFSLPYSLMMEGQTMHDAVPA